MLLKGRAEDQTNDLPIAVFASLHQECDIQRFHSPLTSFPSSLGSQWKVYLMQSILRKRHLLSFNARPSHGPGTLHISLSQPYHSPGATLFHAVSQGKSSAIRCQEPRRGRSLFAPEGGVILLSFGFSLSRHRSKLVPES